MVLEFLLLAVLVAIGVAVVTAIRRYSERPKRDPLAEAGIQLARGRKDKAIRVLEAAHARYPARSDIARKLEELRRDRTPLAPGNPARLRVAFPRPLIIAIFLIGVMASVWQQMGRHEGAKFVDAKRLATDAYYQLERNPFDKDQVAQAVIKIQIARVIDSREPWVHIAISLAGLVTGYQNGDRYELESYDRAAVAKALEHANESVQLGPNESQAHAQLARVKIIRGEYKEALEILNGAHDLDPQNFYPWYLRGVVAEKMRDTDGATSNLDEAEKRVTHAYQRRLVNLARQSVAGLSGDYATQERLLLENIKDQPDDAYAYGDYAHFLMTRKRYDEAVTYWEKAVEKRAYRHALEELEEAKRLRDRSRKENPISSAAAPI